MEANVQIIVIVAVAIVILATLFLNRGRLKRLGIKASSEGFEVEAQMTDDNQNENREAKKKVVAEQIRQKGDRNKMQTRAEDVEARDIEQEGNDNEINLGS